MINIFYLLIDKNYKTSFKWEVLEYKTYIQNGYIKDYKPVRR